MCHRRAALSFSSLFQSLKDRFLFAPRLFFRKASAKLQPFFQPAKLYGNFFTFSSDFFARKGKKGKSGGRIGRFVTEKARPEGKGVGGKNTSPSMIFCRMRNLLIKKKIIDDVLDKYDKRSYVECKF